MAATERPTLGVNHVTVVPSNFEPEPDHESRAADASAADE